MVNELRDAVCSEISDLVKKAEAVRSEVLGKVVHIQGRSLEIFDDVAEEDLYFLKLGLLETIESGKEIIEGRKQA